LLFYTHHVHVVALYSKMAEAIAFIVFRKWEHFRVMINGAAVKAYSNYASGSPSCYYATQSKDVFVLW